MSLIATLAVLSATAGCTSGAVGSEGKSPLSDAPGSSASGLRSLDGYWAIVNGPDPDKEAEFTSREEGTAQCMAELGFEYWPIPYAEQTRYEEDPSLGLSPSQFAEEYGFGISIWPPAADPETTPTISRYLSYLEGLTPTARDAYYIALYGRTAPVETTEALERVRELPEGDSCAERLDAQLQAESQTDQEAQYRREASDTLRDLLEGEYQRLEEESATEPRNLAAREEYSDCLADAGFPGFEYRGDTLYESFRKEFNELFPDSPNIVDRAALREFQKRELAAAGVEATCAAPVVEVNGAVTKDLEQDVIDRIGPQLEAWEELYGPYLK